MKVVNLITMVITQLIAPGLIQVMADHLLEHLIKAYLWNPAKFSLALVGSPSKVSTFVGLKYNYEPVSMLFYPYPAIYKLSGSY